MSDVELGNIFYNIVANDLTSAGTNAANGNFAAMGLAIGAGITAVGGAGVAMIDQNNQLMGSIDAVSQETGIEADNLRDLTMALANGEDSIDEVTSTMAALGKFGVTTAEGMDTATTAALALGDANSSTGDEVTNNVVPALQAYGLTVDDLGSKSDDLTEIVHSTKYGLTDVTNILAKAAPTATAAGLSFDDMTTMIEAMGQKGVPARLAVSEIDDAIKAAAKTSADGKVSADELSESLGLTAAQYDAATAKLDGDAGSTAAYNKIAQDHVGLMANISSWWEKTTDNVGAALTPYSSMFTAMTAVGGVMTAANGLLMLNNTLHITSAISTAASTVATEAATAAEWLFNAAMDANPIGIIILAVAGLAAGIIYLDSQFHFIQPTIEALMGIFQDIWNVIQNVISGIKNVGSDIANIPGISQIISGAGSIAGAFASGGDANAGETYLVGEKGPELFTPTSSGTVSPNNALGGGSGGDSYTDSSSNTYNVTVNASQDYPLQSVMDDAQKLRSNRITMGSRTGS